MRTALFLPVLQATAAVVFWGASFVATKIALRYLTPDMVVWLRFAMGLAVMGLVVAARIQFQLPRRADLPYFALLGLIGITFHQWLQSNGLVTAQATTTAWIVATTPVFIALLGWLVLKETLSGFQALGIFMAAAGVMLVVSQGRLSALGLGQGMTGGDLLVMISAPNWAVFSIISRRGLKQHPAARMMLFVMGFGWVFTSLLMLFNPRFDALARLPVDGWLSMLFLGIFCSGLAYVFWYDAMKALPASQVGVFLYIEPLVTVVVAWALLGERLSWASLLGGIVILAGVALVNRAAPSRLGRKSEKLIRDSVN